MLFRCFFSTVIFSLCIYPYSCVVNSAIIYIQHVFCFLKADLKPSYFLICHMTIIFCVWFDRLSLCFFTCSAKPTGLFSCSMQGWRMDVGVSAAALLFYLTLFVPFQPLKRHTANTLLIAPLAEGRMSLTAHSRPSFESEGLCVCV